MARSSDLPLLVTACPYISVVAPLELSQRDQQVLSQLGRLFEKWHGAALAKRCAGSPQAVVPYLYRPQATNCLWRAAGTCALPFAQGGNVSQLSWHVLFIQGDDLPLFHGDPPWTSS